MDLKSFTEKKNQKQVFLNNFLNILFQNCLGTWWRPFFFVLFQCLQKWLCE